MPSRRPSLTLADLNAGGDAVDGVRFTTFRTLNDELVRPVDNATLRDGAVNVLVQSQCWLRPVGHVGLILDGAVYSGIRQASRDVRRSGSTASPCEPTWPEVGSAPPR